MSYIIYSLVYVLAGITWSRVLEDVIKSEVNINGYESSLEANLHVFLWPISLSIFIFRYIQVFITGK